MEQEDQGSACLDDEELKEKELKSTDPTDWKCYQPIDEASKIGAPGDQ